MGHHNHRGCLQPGIRGASAGSATALKPYSASLGNARLSHGWQRHFIIGGGSTLPIIVRKSQVKVSHDKVMISGDEPMNADDSAQDEAPDPAAAEQGKTDAMLKKEAG